MIAGNLKVFKELGPIFAKTIHCWDEENNFNEEKFNALLASLVPGEKGLSAHKILDNSYQYVAHPLLGCPPSSFLCTGGLTC